LALQHLWQWWKVSPNFSWLHPRYSNI